MDTLGPDAAERRRPSARRLLTGLLVGVLVALGVTGVIVAKEPGVPASLGELLHGTPTPTATIALGGGVVFYEHGAPWGRLTVDGRPVPVGGTPGEGVLGRGRHSLAYEAAPFPALRCTISTPAAASDTCPLDPAFTDSRGQPLGGRRAVDLLSTPERLPAGQRDALIAAVRRAVEHTSPVATVHPGELYAGINGDAITRETATQPLDASIETRLQTEAIGAADPNNAPPGCAGVCLPPPWWQTTDAAQPADALEVWAHTKTGYHYTTPGGAVALDFGPLRQTQQAAWRPDGVDLVIVRWDGAWQVTPAQSEDGMSPCVYGTGDLYGEASAGDPLQGRTLTGTRPAPNPTDGCLLILRPGTGETTAGPPTLFLERFGVLLAVGEDAHQLRPYLPVADAQEAAEAWAIAALAPLP